MGIRRLCIYSYGSAILMETIVSNNARLPRGTLATSDTI